MRRSAASVRSRSACAARRQHLLDAAPTPADQGGRLGVPGVADHPGLLGCGGEHGLDGGLRPGGLLGGPRELDLALGPGLGHQVEGVPTRVLQHLLGLGAAALELLVGEDAPLRDLLLGRLAQRGRLGGGGGQPGAGGVDGLAAHRLGLDAGLLEAVLGLLAGLGQQPGRVAGGSDPYVVGLVLGLLPLAEGGGPQLGGVGASLLDHLLALDLDRPHQQGGLLAGVGDQVTRLLRGCVDGLLGLLAQPLGLGPGAVGLLVGASGVGLPASRVLGGLAGLGRALAGELVGDRLRPLEQRGGRRLRGVPRRRTGLGRAHHRWIPTHEAILRSVGGQVNDPRRQPGPHCPTSGQHRSNGVRRRTSRDPSAHGPPVVSSRGPTLRA